MKFTIMWMDTPQMNVYLDGVNIKSEILVEKPVVWVPLNIYPDKITHHTFNRFLESRVPDKRRADIDLILKRYDIPFFNPIWMIQKSYGRNMNDFLWIKIDDKEVSFNDIRLR